MITHQYRYYFTLSRSTWKKNHFPLLSRPCHATRFRSLDSSFIPHFIKAELWKWKTSSINMMPIDLRGFFFLFINNFTMSIQRKSITKRIFNLAFANKKKTRNWIKMRNDEFKNFICREVCTLKLNFPRFPSPQISIFMLFCDFPHCSPLHCIALKKSARVKIEWGKLKCNLASFREKRVKILKSMEGL